MEKDKNKNLIVRPPVVVILGHVDHGKSSILEAIKDLKITSKESGGITQHIGAYEVTLHSDAKSSRDKKVEGSEEILRSTQDDRAKRTITFIDTPGHEAFSAMRARGAKVADIAVLVVSAEEGVKEQTKEAINHIKEAKIPFIVAINKIDKPEANPEKVKRELSVQEVLTESMGGKIPSVEVSATTKKGINDLLDMILLLAEMDDLKADISKSASGFVIESYQDSNRGATATIILQEGILKNGDIIATDSAFGKVKILENFQGKPVKEVLPSMPAIVLGFENVPVIGEKFFVFSDFEEAKKNIKEKKKEEFNAQEKENLKVLNIVLKVDVHGSLEAVKEIFKTIPQEKAFLRIVKSDVGEINESDIKFAIGAKAAIVGFRVKVSPIAKSIAIKEKIKIKTFDIIYELVQAVREALNKTLEPDIIRIDLGKVKILAIFKNEKTRQIIGGKVSEGEIKKGAQVEVFRNDEKIGKGRIIGLKRDKKDIDEATKGAECGILFEGDAKAEQGDILQAYREERRKAEL